MEAPPCQGMNELPAAEVTRRLTAFAQAKTDREAAKLLGFSESTFRNWRVRQGIESKNTWNGTPISDAEFDRRIEAWASSPSRLEAAKELGMTLGAFGWWQQTQGLPANSRLCDDQTDEHSKQARYTRAYYEARNDQEAATLLRVPPEAFTRWRRRQGLEPASRTHARRMTERRELRIKNSDLRRE